MVVQIDIVKSSRPGKKYDAIIHREDGRTKTVPFGQAGASDYTAQKEKGRVMRYTTRLQRNKDWTSER